MLRLSKKMIFAIEAVVDIAYHSSGQPVQSQEITLRQDIPRRYLEQALQQLVRATILTGGRGPKGGYNLARERRRISVGDIVRVVRNLETGLEMDGTNPGSELSAKVITPMWQNIQTSMMEELDGISIDDLCTQANDAGVESEGRQNLDFSI